MDFSPDPEQQAVADVVTSVLDRDNSWEALVSGGVTALPAPERIGGDGVGLAEVATALTEIGRHGAVTPKARMRLTRAAMPSPASAPTTMSSSCGRAKASTSAPSPKPPAWCGRKNFLGKPSIWAGA